MTTPSADPYAARRSRTCPVSSAALAGLSPARISVAVGGARSYSSTSATSRPTSIGSPPRPRPPPPAPPAAATEHRLVRLRELDAAEPRAAQQRADPAGVGEREGSRRPGLLAEA